MSLLLLFGSAGAPATTAPTAYEQPAIARRRTGWRVSQQAPDPSTFLSHDLYRTRLSGEAFQTRTQRSRRRVDLLPLPYWPLAPSMTARVAPTLKTKTLKGKRIRHLPPLGIYPPASNSPSVVDELYSLRSFRGRRLRQLPPLDHYAQPPTTPDPYPARELEKAARRYGWRKKLSAIDLPTYTAHQLYDTKPVSELFQTRKQRSRRHLRGPDLVTANAAEPPVEQPISAVIPGATNRRYTRRRPIDNLLILTSLPVQPWPSWQAVASFRRHGTRTHLELPDATVLAEGTPTKNIRPIADNLRLRVLRGKKRLRQLPPLAPVADAAPPPEFPFAAAIPPRTHRRHGRLTGTEEIFVIASLPVQPLPAWIGVSTNRRHGWRIHQPPTDPSVAAGAIPPIRYGQPDDAFAVRSFRGHRLRVLSNLIVDNAAAPVVVPEAAWLPAARSPKRRDTTARPDIEVVDFIASIPVQPEPAWRAVKAMRHRFRVRLQRLPALHTYPQTPQPQTAWTRALEANRRHGNRWLRGLPELDVFAQIPPTPAQHPVSWIPRAAFRRNGWRTHLHGPDWLPADPAPPPVIPPEPPAPGVGPAIGYGPAVVKEWTVEERKKRAREAYYARRRRRDEEEVILLLATLLDSYGSERGKDE